MEKRVVINVTFSFPVIPVCPDKKAGAGIQLGEDLDNGLVCETGWELRNCQYFAFSFKNYL